MRNTIYPYGSVTVTLTANQKICVQTDGSCQIYQQVNLPNYAPSLSLLTELSNGVYTSSAFTTGATIVITSNSPSPAYYETGTTPTVQFRGGQVYQPAPNALDATGTLTGAMIMGGIVTSSTAAAVTATLDTGTVMDTVSNFAINDGSKWSAINTGGANAFTVTASSGHTIVGSGTVAASSSARFLTRKTAANTFVTYRI